MSAAATAPVEAAAMAAPGEVAADAYSVRDLSVEELDAFRMERWVRLPALRRHTIPSRVVPLSPRLLAYLLEDGILLPPPPPDTVLSRADPRAERVYAEEEDEEDEEDEERGSGSDGADGRSSDAPPLRAPEPFVEEEHAIMTVLEHFRGGVFPRLSWKAPRDAGWANTGSLECGTAGDVFRVLKASDFITDSVADPYRHCAGHVRDATAAPPPQSLILRRWSRLHPSSEWRLFVADGRLVAATQRRVSAFYPFLPDTRASILPALRPFARDVVAPAFAPVRRLVADAYVDVERRVWLVDAAPWHAQTTHSLLFSWEELDALALAGREHGEGVGADGESPVPVRVVMSPGDVAPSAHLETAPLCADIVDLAERAAADTDGLAAGDLVRLLQEAARDQDREDEGGDEDEGGGGEGDGDGDGT